jgi:hypothetical protein
VNREQGTGNREQRTENREQGTENREQGTENREQGTGNREQGTGVILRALPPFEGRAMEGESQGGEQALEVASFVLKSGLKEADLRQK